MLTTDDLSFTAVLIEPIAINILPAKNLARRYFSTV
jgi:hypothetical protein